MKIKPAFLLFTICTAIILCGCATSQQKPPTATEAKFFDITTNYVPVIQTKTNVVVVTDPITSAPVTNAIVVLTTNLQPQYVFVPNAVAQETAATAGAIGNLVTPGGGGLIGTIVGGVFGLWGMLRSRRANQTSAVLAQIIETGDQVLKSLPNGAEVAANWKAWMIKHQAQTDTIQQATSLVASIVDTESARKAAEEINRLIAKTKA